MQGRRWRPFFSWGTVMSYNKALHTSSYYAVAEIETELNDNTFSSSGDISYLESREQQFYNQFGADSYEEFQTKIKEAFNENDIQVIQNFSPENLTRSLQVFANKTASLLNEEVQITFDLSKIRESNKKLRDTLDFSTIGKDVKVVSQSKDTVQLGFVYNTVNIKNVLNKMFKDRKFKAKEGSTLQNVDNLIFELINNNNAIQIQLGGANNNFQENFEVSQIPNFPWGVTKKYIEVASQDKNSKAYMELQRAARTIKDFVFNELGGNATPDLKKAMLLVWQNQGFYAKTEEPLLFFKGTTTSNFIGAVQGNFGEFQSAVIITYLNIKLNSKYSKIATILGDNLKNKEKVKVDVSFFNNYGAQVKHYNLIKQNGNTNFLRKIETTIHPNEFDKYGNGVFSLSSFLANYYFNTTYQAEVKNEMSAIKRQLGDYLGELMNMEMSEAVKEDKVTFYFIGGKYFVPASAILKAAEKLQLKDSIEITSSYKGLSDIAYELPIIQSSQGKNIPLFTKYWRRNSSGWKMTGENLSTYHSLISKDISIRTNFDYWDELENYIMF